MVDRSTVEHLARIVIQGVGKGQVVEIDGLGSFVPDAGQGFRFEPHRAPQVFVAYVKEDEAVASLLYDGLEAAGFSPWMDVKKLVPGQNWPRAIEAAIETSDFFLACYSENSVNKKGGFQAEIRYALDCARQIPLDEIFLVPVRLNRCPVPRSIQREIQYVDLFPEWSTGFIRLVTMMRREVARRSGSAVESRR